MTHVSSIESSTPCPIGLCDLVANHVSVGIMLINKRGEITLFNQWFRTKSGFEVADVLGKKWFQIFPELSNHRIANAITSAIHRQLPSVLSQSLNKAPFPLFEKSANQSERIQQAIHITPLKSADGEAHCLIQVHDVSIAVKKERLLREQAETLRGLALLDSLTGIGNRRRLDEYLGDEFKRAKRSQSPLSVILIDIDYFKNFNDTYGHQNGDFCLQRVANAIKATLQRPADLAARYGGEEFAVILPDTSFSGALGLAEELQKNIESLAIPNKNSPVAPYITLSLGVSKAQSYAKLTEADLLAQADKALYQAKNAGRNRVVVYDEETLTS